MCSSSRNELYACAARKSHEKELFLREQFVEGKGEEGRRTAARGRRRDAERCALVECLRTEVIGSFFQSIESDRERRKRKKSSSQRCGMSDFMDATKSGVCFRSNHKRSKHHKKRREENDGTIVEYEVLDEGWEICNEGAEPSLMRKDAAPTTATVIGVVRYLPSSLRLRFPLFQDIRADITDVKPDVEALNKQLAAPVLKKIVRRGRKRGRRSDSSSSSSSSSTSSSSDSNHGALLICSQ